MSFRVLRLNADDAALAWPKIAPFIEAAIAEGPGLYEAEDVREMVTRPESGTPFAPSLWLIAEGDQPLGAWVTEVRRFPRTRVLIVGFAGGREMPRWYDIALAETEKFARDAECSRIHCEGRKGWGRLGYQPIGYWYERAIG